MTESLLSSKDLEIKTPHFRYAVKKWGDDGGIPILGLHGWLDNGSTFDRLAPLLDNVCLYSLDLPGHGYSGHRPKGIKYHYLDYIADIIAVLDSLNLRKVILMGHSLGGGLASIVAGTFPDRVDKLVLIEGIGPMTRDPENSPQYLLKSIEQMKTSSNRMPPVYKSVDEIIAARAKVGDVSLESVKILVKRGIIELEDGVTWRSDPRLRVVSPSYLTEEQVNAFLKRITVPTLLITSENGLFSDEQRLQARCDQIENLKHEHIPGNHHVHLDNPDAVAVLINSFLKK